MAGADWHGEAAWQSARARLTAKASHGKEREPAFSRVPMASFYGKRAPMTYIPLVSSIPITVVELPLFQRLAANVWDDAEREVFVDFIARNPEAGDVIPETGGVRKVRWRRQGTGTRGGVRVIYFYHDVQMPVFLLLVYAKAQREDMTPDQKKQVRGLAATLKQAYGRKG